MRVFLWLAALAAAALTLRAAADPVPTTFSFVGKEQYVMNGYVEAELMRHYGHGCLTHMWFGGDGVGYEKTRIRIYVDGEKIPSIDMELGMGHAAAFNDPAAPYGSDKLGKTGHPSGLYNTFRIPFGKSIRITGQHDRNTPDKTPFWWIFRGSDNLPVTLGGVRLPDSARLHLYKVLNKQVAPHTAFDLCNVTEDGALLLVAEAAKSHPDNTKQSRFGFMEGMLRAYIGGAQKPIYLSSGMEDYFLGTYYFNRGRYATALAGVTHLDPAEGSFSGYRFHDADPVFFKNGFRLSLRCGEDLEPGETDDIPPTEYTTYTWLYQWPRGPKSSAQLH